MKARTGWIALLTLGGLCAGLSGCAEPEPPRPRHPVVVVAVDGLEWDVILPMLHEGRLPHLAGMMQRGAYGELATMQRTLSPVIWASVVTGVPPEQHGILDFLCDEPGGGGAKRLCTSSDRRVKALWHILGDHGLRTDVVGWWQTYPVEPINGVMVAQTNTDVLPEEMQDPEQPRKGSLWEGVPHQVHPPERTPEILSVVPEVEHELEATIARIFGGATAVDDAVVQRLWQRCIWAFRADAIYRRAALKLLADEEPADLFLVYFGGADLMGHRFWRYYKPELFADRPSPEHVAALGDVIPAYYAEMDRVLGEILAAAPPTANVFVVSDHGMHAVNVEERFTPDREMADLRSGAHYLTPPGILVAAGPDIRPLASAPAVTTLLRQELPRVGSVMDVTPTLLAMLGLPVGKDMQGRAMLRLLADPPEIAFVDSHTPRDWYAGRSGPASDPRDPVAEAERLEQLRSLGYIN
jgi:predicted AlkP superfamily phosphohydrolase/phosphomutase